MVMEQIQLVSPLYFIKNVCISVFIQPFGPYFLSKNACLKAYSMYLFCDILLVRMRETCPILRHGFTIKKACLFTYFLDSDFISKNVYSKVITVPMFLNTFF